MKKLLLTLLFVTRLYAQNDTIRLNSYYQAEDTVHNTLIFRDVNQQVMQGIFKNGNCYTRVENGIVTERRCYDEKKQLVSKLYKTPDGYTNEVYGKRLTKMYFDGRFNSVAEEVFCNDTLSKRVAYKKYFEISREYYYKNGKELFRFEYHNGVPEFYGDTLTQSGLANGLLFKHDTLYAIQDKTTVAYKYYSNGILRHYWSEPTRMLWDDTGALTALKTFKRSKQVFKDEKEDYFEYSEHAKDGSITLMVRSYGQHVSNIQIIEPTRQIEISYSLNQLQQATIREPFEGGCYITTIKQNGSATKIRLINNSDGYTTRDEIKGFTFFPDGYDGTNFLKTANILTLQEYETICARALSN